MRAICKFTCESVDDPVGGDTAKRVRLVTDYNPDDAEDTRFTDVTPWGEMFFGLSNPNLDGFFVPGRVYRITIEAAPVEEG